jgi:hypothetical protein
MFKKKKSNLCKTLAVIGLMLLSTVIYAHVPAPPPGSGQDGTSYQERGGVPVGFGIVILLSLGAVYGGKKLNKAMHCGNEEMEDQ